MVIQYVPIDSVTNAKRMNHLNQSHSAMLVVNNFESPLVSSNGGHFMSLMLFATKMPMQSSLIWRECAHNLMPSMFRLLQIKFNRLLLQTMMMGDLMTALTQTMILGTIPPQFRLLITNLLLVLKLNREAPLQL